MAEPTQIVNEMIARLRALQGSGEYVPLARRVNAGAGLSGGGELSENVTVSLSAETRAEIQDRVTRGDWENLNQYTQRREQAIQAGFVAVQESITEATSGAIRQVEGQSPVRISVGNIEEHDEAAELPGVLYLLFEED